MPEQETGYSRPDGPKDDTRRQRTAAVKPKLAECLSELDELGLHQSAAYVQMGIDALPSA